MVRRIVLLAAMTAFPPMAIDQYLPALPAIGRDLGASPGAVQATLSAFFIGFSAGQLICGPLSDRFGRRLPLVAGIVLFIAASIACAVSPSVGVLTASRLIQGLGAAAGSVIGRAMVRDLYEGAEAARILSLMMLVMSVAPLAAPVLGGYLTVAFGWASNFWALALFGLLCLAGLLLGLPESLPPERRHPASLGKVLANYASLLATRRFVSYALSSGLAFSGYFAYVAGSPFVFIGLYHVPVSLFGYLFGLNVVGMMAGSLINTRLVGRVGVDRMLGWGLGVAAAAGVGLVACGATGAGGLPGLFAAIFLYVAVQGLISANAMAGALAVRPDLAGTAAALAGVSSFALGALAAALVAFLSNGTALPMAGAMAAAGLAALLVRVLW